MFNLPGEYILTCDPGLSEHSDSTDFDGTSSPIIYQRKKQKYWKNFRPKPKRDINTPTCSSSYTVTQNSSKEIWESQTISQKGTLGVKVRKSYKNKTCKTLDDGDKIETIKSKRALTRRKVIPCLSHMFGRTSNNVKQMSIIRENATENVNIDTGCQASRVNGEHKIRKFNRSQPLYAVQPVYAVEGNAHAKPSPFQHTKIVREPLLNRNIVTKEKDVWSFTSSSEDNKSNRFLKHESYERNVVKPSKYRHKMSDDVCQEYHRKKERSKRHKYADEQCSIEFNRNYEVFTYPCMNQSNAGSGQMASNPMRCSNNEPPLSCSAFWEYILNRLNEQQNQPNKRSKACSCRLCDKSLCANDYSQGQGSQTGFLKKAPCSCSTLLPKCASTQASVKDIPLSENTTACKEACFKNESSSKESKAKPGEKVYCKCYPGKKKQRPKSSDNAAPNDASIAAADESKESARPCQLSHTNITESLSQKYRGEILCIHNPPCVLINGCLNLPPTKEEMTMDTYPGTTSQAYRFCSSPTTPYNYQHQPNHQYCMETCQRNPYIIQDTACQYASPIMDIRPNTKRSCSITKPASVIDNSCQYQPSSFELLNQKSAANDSCRQYRISSNEIQKLRTINESCQYWLSPSEMDNSQNDLEETCFYCREEAPTEIRKSHNTHSKEKVRGIDIRLPKARKEKIMQSICNHNPPCEIVRTCCKAPFDPKLQNSCVHVPMCKKVPLCVMEQKCQNEAFRSCQHRPKCVEVPICTRNYIALTAKEEIATQVLSKYKVMCRHEPPCTMVERCLARACDSCLPCDPIPECVHQPMCEMIPACCRKPAAKEMVSVHTQYPNQCSLV